MLYIILSTIYLLTKILQFLNGQDLKWAIGLTLPACWRPTQFCLFPLQVPVINISSIQNGSRDKLTLRWAFLEPRKISCGNSTSFILLFALWHATTAVTPMHTMKSLTWNPLPTVDLNCEEHQLLNSIIVLHQVLWKALKKPETCSSPENKLYSHTFNTARLWCSKHTWRYSANCMFGTT